MGKIRKNVRRKKFRYTVNRKRLNKDKTPTSQIACQVMKESWNRSKSAKVNMKRMGLAFDLNRTSKSTQPTKLLQPEVVQSLEQEANAPRRKAYRMPNNQVQFLIEMLDKYGENYIQMAKDKKNYGQLTPKQLQRKVLDLKKIPEQYQVLVEHRKGKQVDDSGTKTPIVNDRGEL